VNDYDDLDELERELGPSLQLALRRAAGQVTDERPPTTHWLRSTAPTAPASWLEDAIRDLGDREAAATDATVVGVYPSPDPRPAHRRRVVVAVAAAALLLVAGGVLVRAATDDDAPGVVPPAGPRPSSTTDSAPPLSERPTAVPPGGAPSTPETGTLLPGLPDIPVFVYEDGRVIWPDVTASPSPSEALGEVGPWNWFERRLTSEGLEFVRAEIRPGGRLDPAAPVPEPPWRWYLDGERELPMGEYTRLEYPDLSWIPVRMWEDPEPTPFVSSHYAVCLTWVDGDLSALLARLPAAVTEPFVGAGPAEPPPVPQGEGTGYRSRCFDLATDDAREVEAALDTAGVSRPNGDDLFYFFVGANADPQWPDVVGFTPYLPHGNPVTSRDVA
jgi:hypothetical protein